MNSKNEIKKRKILCVPVSAAKGSGEYQRLLLLMNHLERQQPNRLDIRFVISEEAAYADQVPYQTYKLTASATSRPKELHKILDEFLPDAVLFDSSGRVKSYRYAKNLGCKVALVVSRPKKRKRALSYRVARHLNLVISTSHIPTLCELSGREKQTSSLCSSFNVVLVNALFQIPHLDNAQNSLRLPEKYCLIFLTGGEYIFNNINIQKLSTRAAQEIVKQTGLTCVLIDPKVNRPFKAEEVITLPMQENVNFMNLVNNAEICVVGTGAVAAQVLVLNKPSVMVATSNTGKKYLADYVSLGVTKPASLSPQEIADSVESLQKREEEKAFQARRRKECLFSNGLEQATSAIEEMLVDSESVDELIAL